MPRILKTKLEYVTAVATHELDHFAKAARRHRLYIKGWQMYDWLYYLKEIQKIVICKYNQAPIAIGVSLSHMSPRDPNIGIYVKKGYRNKGIGKNIFKQLTDDMAYVIAGQGLPASIPFYRKCRELKDLELITYE